MKVILILIPFFSLFSLNIYAKTAPTTTPASSGQVKNKGAAPKNKLRKKVEAVVEQDKENKATTHHDE